MNPWRPELSKHETKTHKMPNYRRDEDQVPFNSRTLQPQWPCNPERLTHAAFKARVRQTANALNPQSPSLRGPEHQDSQSPAPLTHE